MKSRSWLILCCVCCWIGPFISDANANAELIEQFSKGQINWTRGLVAAKGVTLSKQPYIIEQNAQTTHPAFEQAVRNVFHTLMQLRVDDQRCASHLLDINRSSQVKVEEMVRASKMVYLDKMPSGVEEASVQMSLYDGFAQLMLPAEIRQVQPIRPLSNTAHTKSSQKVSVQISNSSHGPDGYTGLVVDARGIGAMPSMVPTLMDEQGQVVFGPAYVSREFAVQRGICQYVRLMTDSWSELPRVAPTPLIVKGLRTAVRGSCNIVISNADASKLRGTSAHLAFLKKCRVIIVLE